MTKGAEMRGGIQGMKQGSADKALVRSEEFELTVYQREQFFFERCFTKPWIVAHGSNSVINFLLEEKERDILLSVEVIKDSAFGDAGFARDRFGGGGFEAFSLKKCEGCFNDAVADQLFVLGPLTRLARPVGFCLRMGRHDCNT